MALTIPMPHGLSGDVHWDQQQLKWFVTVWNPKTAADIYTSDGYHDRPDAEVDAWRWCMDEDNFDAWFTR